MPQPSSSGRATTKPWQPAAQQRPSAFDRYGTFPDIRDDEDNDDHIETALTTTNKEYARAGSSRSLGSGASGEAALDPDYDIIPMYVVPLFKHQMVVIPVPKPGPGGAQGPEWMKSVVNTGQAMQKKAAETWDSLKNSDPDSIKNKVYRCDLHSAGWLHKPPCCTTWWSSQRASLSLATYLPLPQQHRTNTLYNHRAGQAQLEALSPEQRMLGGIPEYARKLKVMHAPCVDHEEVLFYMGETIRKLGHVQRYKQARVVYWQAWFGWLQCQGGSALCEKVLPWPACVVYVLDVACSDGARCRWCMNVNPCSPLVCVPPNPQRACRLAQQRCCPLRLCSTLSCCPVQPS